MGFGSHLMVLSASSWLCAQGSLLEDSGDPLGCWGSNWSAMCKASYLLHSLSSPFFFFLFYFLFFFFAFWVTPSIAQGLLLAHALRNYSRRCLGDHIGCWKLNPGQPRARQMPHCAISPEQTVLRVFYQFTQLVGLQHSSLT